MAKKFSLLVIIFLAFYLGAHFYMRFQAQKSKPVEASRLVSCEDNNVRAIGIDTKDGANPVRLEFRRTDTAKPGTPAPAQLAFSEWSYNKPYGGIEADSTALVRLASVFCDIYDPNPSPRGEELGASSELATGVDFVVAGPKGEETHHLTFGKVTTDRNQIVEYRAPDGSVKLVRISPKLAQLASVLPKDFRNMRVMRMPADLLETVSLQDGAKKERFTLERAGSAWGVKVASKLVGMGSEDSDKFVNRLGTLRALEVEVRPAGPCPESRDLALELKGLGGREEEITFSYGKEGNLKVCNSSRPTFFQVHRDLLPFLDVKPAALVEKKAEEKKPAAKKAK